MHMKKRLNSLIRMAAVAVLGSGMTVTSLAGQDLNSEQLLRELRALRDTVAAQQKVIESLQTKVESSIVAQRTMKSELTEEFKQTFASQQPESGVAADSWFNKVEMYGLMHGSLDVLDDGTHLSGNSSRIGFRGDEWIEGDLSAVWQVEISISLDEGGANTNFNLRDTFVGFNDSNYGSLLFGRMDSAFERLHRWTDFFDSQIGDSRNILGFAPGSIGFDRREDNSIKYISPDMGGLTTMLTYSTPEGEQSDSTLAANLAYRNDGGLLLAAGVDVHGEGNHVAGPEKEFGYRLVGSYEWERLKVSAIVEYLDNLAGVDGDDRTSGGFGAAFKVSDKNTLKGQIRHTGGVGDDRESTGYALGLDHSLTERTRLYFAYALTTNESLASNGVTGGGHGVTVTPNAGEDSSGVSFGIVHGW